MAGTYCYHKGKQRPKRMKARDTKYKTTNIVDKSLKQLK